MSITVLDWILTASLVLTIIAALVALWRGGDQRWWYPYWRRRR